jgi:hypothetical protein
MPKGRALKNKTMPGSRAVRNLTAGYGKATIPKGSGSRSVEMWKKLMGGYRSVISGRKKGYGGDQ